MSKNTKLWLIWVSVFVGLYIILTIGILLTWNQIGICVAKCHHCPNNSNSPSIADFDAFNDDPSSDRPILDEDEDEVIY